VLKGLCDALMKLLRGHGWFNRGSYLVQVSLNGIGRLSQFLDACIKRAPVLRVLTRLGKSGFEVSNLGIDVGCGGRGALPRIPAARPREDSIPLFLEFSPRCGFL